MLLEDRQREDLSNPRDFAGQLDQLNLNVSISSSPGISKSEPLLVCDKNNVVPTTFSDSINTTNTTD